MLRRWATVAGGLILALLLFAGFRAVAQEVPGDVGTAPAHDPHGDFTLGTDGCSSCHGSHGAPDDSLAAARTRKAMCLECHSGQPGATDVFTQYMISEGGISPDGTGHRVLPNAESPLQCDDCHTSHQDPAENPGLLRVRVVNVDTGHEVYLYNSTEDPAGNAFCYACHASSAGDPEPSPGPSPGASPEPSPGASPEPSPGPPVRGPLEFRANDPLPAPFGDFTGFELSAHNLAGPMSEAAESDAQQLAEDVGDAPAEGTEEDKAQDSQPVGKIMCLYCHAPHDSDYDGITTADQELLCYVCHTRADPSTGDGTSPYKAFNAADNSYGDGDKGRPADGAVRIFHHPIAASEQQDGARNVECVSCHNPHLDAASNTGNSAQIANPRRTSSAWPPSATIRGFPSVTIGDGRTTAQTVGPSAVSGPQPTTYEGWAGALLTQLEAPSCQDNLLSVVAWQVQEGTAARWNPLATTYSMPGATSINSAGVKNYASFAQGLEATRLTLTGGSSMYGYGLIVARLQNCAPARDTAAAIAASAWCGCGESYLVGLLNMVESNYESYAGTGLPGSPKSFDGSMDTVNSFCTKCHIAPEETNPIRKSDTVPYGIRLINDTALDPGGQPHDLFTASQYPDSLHGSMTCTACHDVHGSSNAYDLRNKLVSPDGSATTSISGFGGMNQPEDRQKYADFCLACHADTAQSHVDKALADGAYCRECHYHGSDQF